MTSLASSKAAPDRRVALGLRVMAEIVRECLKHGFELAEGEEELIEIANKWIHSETST